MAAWFCRYLAESNCAAMCTNLCKSPVQTFFTEELGMPLTMKVINASSLVLGCHCSWGSPSWTPEY